MPHPLKQWITDSARTYQQGLYLYSVYGKYKSVLQLLQGGETPATRAKMLDALKETWQALEPQLKERAQQVTAPVKTSSTQQVPAANAVKTDSTLAAIDAKWKPLYTEMALIHARLGVCTTNEQRLAHARRIVQLEADILKIWADRDTYLATGKLPAKQPRKKVNTAMLNNSQVRELTNLRTYVTRMRKTVLPALVSKQQLKATPRRAARILENEQKLQAWEARIKELENG